VAEMSKLSESDTCEFVKNKGYFWRKYLVFGVSNYTLIYVVGVNSSIEKGAV
jgi:hypothetical protein